MTLLEALVALVILGASAAGALGIFQNGARAVRAADEWNRASAVSAAVLEEAVQANLEGSPLIGGTSRSGLEARVDQQPWQGRVDDIVVRVTLSDGREMTVHRLVRRR